MLYVYYFFWNSGEELFTSQLETGIVTLAASSTSMNPIIIFS